MKNKKSNKVLSMVEEIHSRTWYIEKRGIIITTSYPTDACFMDKYMLEFISSLTYYLVYLVDLLMLY